MPNSDKPAKVTIEDLLRLKRTERPPVEFWNSFERELRQKQLTALLEKRSWWKELPHVFARRAYLPVGATAILAFTLVSLRYYAPVQVVQLEGLSTGASANMSRQAVSQTDNSKSAAVSSSLVNRDGQSTPRVEEQANVLAVPATTISMMDVAPESNSRPLIESPSAKFIADTRAHLEQSEPELINAVLGNRLSVPVRTQVDSGPVVELASLSANGSKRSRLLASYNDRQLAPEPTAPDIVRERLSRRLGDSDYSERFSRIGLKGSQVSLKF